MRRNKKEIKNPKIINELLETAQVGRLGTLDSDGYPMIKPSTSSTPMGRYTFTRRFPEKK